MDPPPCRAESQAEKLERLLHPDGLELLVELLSEVITQTHYGHVIIIVSDGKVVLFKAEKSYKRRPDQG